MLFNKDYNWDIDLSFGEVGEKNLYGIFKDSKIECKRDRMALLTGNMAIEYEQNGKPSGIATSRADYWCYIFTDGDKDIFYFIIPISTLKNIARKYYEEGCIKHCGDNNNVVVLVPTKELFNYKNK